METQNKYCTRCRKTQRFSVNGTIYQCPNCGTISDSAYRNGPIRFMIGDQFAAYRVVTIEDSQTEEN